MSRRCEDYPCCGHTPDDPCGYVGPTSEDMMRNPAGFHLGCDHEAGYCEYILDEDDEDEKEGLDPVSPECKLCPEFADILCQITEVHSGIHLCNRCHRSHIVACYAHFAAS
jgi:hypothetical protein